MGERPHMNSERAPRILVGVDGSEDGHRAIEYAIGEAEATGANLWLLHVAGSDGGAGNDSPAPIRQLADRGRGEQVLAQAMDVVRAATFPESRARTELRFGDPGAGLLSSSADAAAVVMGRTSFTGLTHPYVGDTTVQVAARAQCPVTVVSAVHGAARGWPVAVAVGLGEASESTLDFAFTTARSRDARLIVVHFAGEVLRKEGPALVAESDVGLEGHLAPLRGRYPSTTVTVARPEGPPVDALVATSKAAGLLILGRAREGTRLTGSLRGVLWHARCPVLVTG